MIRKFISRTALLLFCLDQVVLVGALAIALWLKTTRVLPDPLLPIGQHVDLFLRLWPFLALVILLAGAYDLHVAVGRIWPLIRRAIVACVGVAGVWIAGAFYLKMSDMIAYSRAVFTLYIVLVAIGLISVRLLVAEISTVWRARTGHFRRVLVFGGESLGRKLAQKLQRQVFAPVKIVGVTGEVDLPDVPRIAEDEAVTRIRQGEVDHVLVDLPPKRIRLLLRVARAAEIEGVPLQISPSIFPGIHLKPRVDHIGRTPMIELYGVGLPLSGVIAKRTFDLVLSAIGLIVLALPLAIVAALVKFSSPGPVFYTQPRVGLDGRLFNMHKFRTMRTDAEESSGPVWARFNDDRATPLGRFLRKSNIDELPQLWNVFLGHMSLVGPRPERPEFVEKFKPVVRRYAHKHWVKPGITGWAQVNGWRGRTSLRRRIEHDIDYIERWSIWLDVKILYLTLFRGHQNAY
jgi:exopolysaccharide biosynthesis polyprenyl glycosylphosphotransferase